MRQTTYFIGSIKYAKSTIINQSIIQKIFFFINGSKKVVYEQPKGFNSGGF
jgi:hypothetical protein